MKKLFLTAGLLFFAFTEMLFAGEIPALNAPIMDVANIVNADTKNELNNYLATISEQTGIQIAVLTVQNMGGKTIETFSMEAAEYWQLGQAGKDNGVLLTVAMEEHEVRIEVGYGLEGELTDTKSGLIIRNFITPHFRSGNYSEGIESGVRAIAGIVVGDEETLNTIAAAEQNESTTTDDIITMIILVLFGCFFVSIPLLAALSQGRRTASSYQPPLNAGAHDPYGTFLSGSSNGSFGGSHGSSFHHSGHSFHGGGGHFGGGGASGRW